MSFRHVPNKEWGRMNRKEEDRLRGLNGQDRRRALDEQLTPVEFYPEYDLMWCEACEDFH